MSPLPLTLFSRLGDYWHQLSEGTRDGIVSGLIVALAVAAVTVLWKFGGRLLTPSKPTDPKPELVPAVSPQEVKVKVEVVPTTPTPSADQRESARPSTSFVIPRAPVVGFVARRDSEGRNIIERLREELAPERNRLVVLQGPGGVGKTTLAAEAARALGEVFDGRIAWISADGRPTFALSTLLDETATQMGREDLRQLAPDEKAGAVGALLAAEKPLVVLDNFETIGDDEQAKCVEFLSQRATSPALITTRRKIGSARNITIPTMESAEAEEFLKLLIAATSDPSAFAQIDLERVKQVSDGNPLVMQWVIAQIDLAQEASTVLDELTHGGGDAAQRVFDRSFELEYLGDDGRAVLLALSLFVPNASRASLAEVAGFEADLKRLNEGVKRLAGLSLVKTTAGGARLIVEGLTRELAKARLAKSESAVEFRQRFVAYFLSYAKAHAEPTANDFDALEAEKVNAFSSMELAFELGDWLGVMTLMDALSFDGVNGFLMMRGYWEEAVQLGEQALEAARRISSNPKVAHFSHNLAITYQNHGDIVEARQLYNESLKINRKLGNQGGTAVTLHQLAVFAQAQGELDEARRLYNESLDIKKKLGNQQGVANTLHGLGRLAQATGELDEALRLYNESLEIQKKLGNEVGIAMTMHQLAMLAQLQDKLDEAQKLYSDSLEIENKLGNQSGIAITVHQLATLAHTRGKFEDARRLYNESLEISRKLGNPSGIAITLGQLGRLSEDQGKLNDAARLYREALVIFEKLGSPYADLAREDLARVEGKSS